LKNHFELFGLAPAYTLDLVHLDRAYRNIQANIHPDRFAHAGDAERRASMQMATRVNEAYRTLKSPLRRASYLLELNGVDPGFETNTTMPPEFLMEQMELREKLAEARDAATLDAIRTDLVAARNLLEMRIAESIDAKRDYVRARELARKLMFLEKIGNEIDSAHETLET
jgi:molecular chaperone HscB